MPDRMPEDLPDNMPEDMPDRMPDRMPEDMPEHMPENMPGRMPEDMPDRMPNKMSDRMPEDLPVTKCINVMVGITRSKVIFLAQFIMLYLKHLYYLRKYYWYYCNLLSCVQTVLFLGDKEMVKRQFTRPQL